MKGALFLKIFRYIALFFLLVALMTGGLVYYEYTHPKETEHAAALLQGKEIPSPEEEAAREAERAAREQKYLAEEKARQERAAHIEKLKEGMDRDDVGGYTWYSYPSEKEPSPGLHLEPLLGHGASAALRCTILYRYSIHENHSRGWIFGDHLTIAADGYRYTWELEEKRRHDRLAKDAESLRERYQLALDADGVEAFRKAAASRSATFTYWSEKEGKSVSHTLSATEKQRIANMIALYDIWREE